jgi:hypothetical protein
MTIRGKKKSSLEFSPWLVFYTYFYTSTVGKVYETWNSENQPLPLVASRLNLLQLFAVS